MSFPYVCVVLMHAKIETGGHEEGGGRWKEEGEEGERRKEWKEVYGHMYSGPEVYSIHLSKSYLEAEVVEEVTGWLG